MMVEKTTLALVAPPSDVDAVLPTERYTSRAVPIRAVLPVNGKISRRLWTGSSGLVAGAA